MKEINKKSICVRAVSFFGEENQMYKTVEELAELQQAIVKYRFDSDKESRKYNLIEEIVDVEIMLEQLKVILVQKGWYKNYTDCFYFKLEKLDNLLNNKKK
jgi:NTP pyrophosphatase (non-canonical NTP hydrolase)